MRSFLSKLGRRRFVFAITALAVTAAVGLTGEQTVRGALAPHERSAANTRVALGQTASAATATVPTSCSDACTPADQPALDAAAGDANSIAGSSYFTGASVDTTADTVTVYLDNAPQSVIDELQAAHPGTYVIHNDAPATMSSLLQLKDLINPFALRADGIDVVSFGPTVDGHLTVGVSSDVPTAQGTLDSMYGSGIIQVASETPAQFDTYRYSDVSPWNGGDFIDHNGSIGFSDCSSGVPVHDTSTGTHYMLTAAHCFWAFGGQYTTVHNCYRENDGSAYPNCSGTQIGSVTKTENVSAGTTSTDTGLIQASTSVVDFDAAWNSQGRATQIGSVGNQVGDTICTSGAFDGQICSIVISSTNHQLCGDEGWGTFCVNHLNIAFNPNNSNAVASGEGDSGGPVYSYSGSNLQVRGMIDAGTDSKTCTTTPPGTTSPPPARGCSHNLWFMGWSYIANQWGVAPNS